MGPFVPPWVWFLPPASLGVWSLSLIVCRSLVRCPGAVFPVFVLPGVLGSLGLWFGNVLIHECPKYFSCPPSLTLWRPRDVVVASAVVPEPLAAPSGFSAGPLCFSVSRGPAGAPAARGSVARAVRRARSPAFPHTWLPPSARQLQSLHGPALVAPASLPHPIPLPALSVQTVSCLSACLVDCS